jgi:hypothetical protein
VSTSTLVTFCDAMVDMLTAEVAGLGPAIVPADQIHRYLPSNPTERNAGGSRHLAVWSTADEADRAEPLAIGFQERIQILSIMVWEPSPDEGERLVPNEEAAKAFLELHEDILQAIYITANQNLGGTWRMWYRNTVFQEQPGLVRWFQVLVEGRRTQEFT